MCLSSCILPLLMELPVASDGIHLAAYRPRVPLSVNGKAAPAGFDDSDYYQCYGDGSSVTSRASDAVSSYDTLDAPPHYDFYANTEVWGRRRRFRPSLFQLHSSPEVRMLCSLVLLPDCLFTLSFCLQPVINYKQKAIFLKLI